MSFIFCAERQSDTAVNIPADVAEQQSSDTALNSTFWRGFYSIITEPIYGLDTGYVIAAIAALPLLLPSLLVIRLLLFISRGDRYEKLVQAKFFIRAWMFVDVMFLVSATGILYVVAAHGPKNPMLIGLALSQWAKIVLMLIGFYILSFVLLLITRLIPRVSLEINETGVSVAESVSGVLDCSILWWSSFEVVRRVPALNQLEILGLSFFGWIEILISVLIGYNIITLSTHYIAWWLQKVCKRFDPGSDPQLQKHSLVSSLIRRKYLVYYANGAKSSINFILGTLLVLLVWALYVGARLKSIPKAVCILEFGTLTCISFLACSLLWLLKASVSLSWKAQAIYGRFDSKILSTAKQLYFLGILGRHHHDFFNLRYAETVLGIHKAYISGFLERPVFWDRHKFALWILESSSPEINSSMWGKSDMVDDLGNTGEMPVKRLSIRKREKVQHNLLMPQNHSCTLYDIEQIALYLSRAQSSLSKEKYVSDIMHHLETLNNSSSSGTMMETLKQLITGESSSNDAGTLSEEAKPMINDWDKFRELLKEHSFKRSVNVEKILKEKDEGVSDSNDSVIMEAENEVRDPEGGSSEIVSEEARITDEDPKEEMSFLQIRTWVEKAHTDCLFLANLLSSAKEVVDCLNKIIGILLIAATLVVWLLLTGFATPKSFVVVVPPLLAAAFIFGDTCKTLFQGIIFVYSVHPFDVGDLCIIGEKLMVVKATGVWRTTFSKVDHFGSRGEVTYPNFELANKMVINHKTEFDWDDWNDYVEFDLGSPNETNIARVKKLKRVIEDHLKSRKEKFMPSSYSLEMSTREAKVMIVVHFKYKIGPIGDDQDWTYSERLRQKDDMRDECCVYIYNLVIEFMGKHLRQ